MEYSSNSDKIIINVPQQLTLIGVTLNIKNKTNNSSNDESAGLFRRLAALVYDTLIVIAILFLATALAMIFVSLIWGSQSITEDKILIENPFYFSWLVFCWFYYYALCWRKSGQTIGMKAWRIKLETSNHQPLSYKNAALRFFSGLLGLSNIPVLLKEHKGWHDHISNTDIILIKKSRSK